MARFKVPVLKRCRALGISPTYIGINKTSERKPKKSFKKLSEYGVQLREKQRAKFIYDVSEKQFRRYFEKASRRKGITGENLLQILESRLDNILFRSGFAKTRPQARQTKKEHPMIKLNLTEKHVASVVEWLDVNEKELSIKVLRLPEREEIDLPIEEHLIVELYSK